jgi:hypothetical protein
MTVLELFALKEQMGHPDTDPLKLSFAKSLDALRTTLSNLGKHKPDVTHIAIALRGAVVDSYERKAAKAARFKSTTKTKPSCGDPKINDATEAQRNIHAQVKLQHAV